MVEVLVLAAPEVMPRHHDAAAETRLVTIIGDEVAFPAVAALLEEAGYTTAKGNQYSASAVQTILGQRLPRGS